MGEVSKGRGGDQTAKSAVRSYSSKAAADLGVSERTVRNDLRRGKNIAPDVLAEIAGTDMDKGGAFYKRMSDNPPRAVMPCWQGIAPLPALIGVGIGHSQVTSGGK